MILESKAGQVTFFLLGLLLLAIGIGGLINLDDVYLNLVLANKSTFFQVLNKVLTGIALFAMAVCGGFMLRLVVYSIKKCREFAGEPPLRIDGKQVLKSIVFYAIVLTAITGLVLLINYLSKDAVVEKDMFGQDIQPRSAPTKESTK